MAFGQSRIAAHFSPERLTLLHEPFLISSPTNARQLPSFELGNPPKLQPQPKSQLQNSKPRPLSFHRAVFAFVAMCPPSVRRTHSIQSTHNVHFLDDECSGRRGGTGRELLFAFSSPYGIVPLAMNLRRAGRFIVDSKRAYDSAKSRSVTTQFPR